MEKYNIKEKDYIELIKERVLQEKDITLSQIILFGSYARGDFNFDSDIDLLFVTKNNNDSIRNIKYKIERILDDRKYPLDILVYKEKDLDKEKNIIGSLPYNVMKEGKVVYDNRQ